MENNAAINPVAGTFGVIYWTQMKKPITSDRLKLKNGSGEWNRTIGLQVMSLTSYLAAPSRDLESICRGVRNCYKAFPQHVKYFQIIFLYPQLYDKDVQTYSEDDGKR